MREGERDIIFEDITLQRVRRTYFEAGGKKLRVGLAELRDGKIFTMFLCGLSWLRKISC